MTTPAAMMRAIAPDFILGFDDASRPVIHCHYGRVVMVAPDRLVWQFAPRRRPEAIEIVNRVQALPFVRPASAGGIGVELEFPADHLPEVARIVGCKLRGSTPGRSFNTIRKRAVS